MTKYITLTKKISSRDLDFLSQQAKNLHNDAVNVCYALNKNNIRLSEEEIYSQVMMNTKIKYLLPITTQHQIVRSVLGKFYNYFLGRRKYPKFIKKRYFFTLNSEDFYVERDKTLVFESFKLFDIIDKYDGREVEKIIVKPIKLTNKYNVYIKTKLQFKRNVEVWEIAKQRYFDRREKEDMTFGVGF